MPNTAPENSLSGNTSSGNTVHVAVGVLLNPQKQVLVALRPEKLHQGGLWEFPGGKVEDSEDVVSALRREFREEVNIEVEEASPFMVVQHDYGDKQVLLDVWLSHRFSGEAVGQEGQRVEWVNAERLASLEFPEANLPILGRLLALLSAD